MAATKKRHSSGNSGHEPKHASASKHASSTPSQQSQPSAKPRRRPSGSTGKMRPTQGNTGSLSATNPGRPRKGNTGSLSATNPGRVRTGDTGSLSATNPRRPRKGNTGSLSATNPGRVRTGDTGSLSATNPGRPRKGNTGSLSATNPGRVRSNEGVAYKSAPQRHGHGKGRKAPSHAAAPARRQRSGFPVFGVILILVLIAGLGVGGFFLVRNIMHPYEGAQVEDGIPVTVQIPEGSTGSQIIQILLDAGVIHSTSDFMHAVKQQNADQSLRSGTYAFTTGSDPAVVVQQLVIGPNSNQGQLQVPEGLTVAQTADLVESSLGIPKQDFLNQAKASNYTADFPFLEAAVDDSLEGYLYPKTYDLSGKDVNADTVIRQMLSQYEAEVKEIDFTAAEAELSERYNLNATDYDVLKIASIIEKELGGNHEDGYKVSSVIYNRLMNNMALQSDATMMFVTGGYVSTKDLETDSPYNTYMYKGLPPTPICSPSITSIEQAAHPADTDYFYFILFGDHHAFTSTYEEHEAAIAEYRESQKQESDKPAEGDQPAEGTEAQGEAQQQGEAEQPASEEVE